MHKKHVPIITFVLLFLMVVIMYFFVKNSAKIKVDFHNGKYVGADKCKGCHQANYKSWKKTYHRTMTQEASDLTVQGDFDGADYTYWGITIRPVRRNNKYFFDYFNPNTKQFLYSLQITRTVGSRRYQQYLAQTPNTQGNYYRLELLWHIEDKRWVHLNGSFLGNDNQAFDSHTGIWNQNCIFCHNTGIKPNMTNYDAIVSQTKAGKPLNLKKDSRFQSHVSDLGIACESCHANGDKHIQLNQNPIRRYFLHYTNLDDNSIVNPSKLSAQKSMDICGQCHGQRTPKSYVIAREWMEDGPSYKPGDVLQDTVNPVWQVSQLNNTKSHIFATRFWQDGTPRLTAYEYQGLLQSQCHIKGDLTCNDCHNMHEGNPKGMIKEENLTNNICLGCHSEFINTVQKHTGHKKNSEGSVCYNCHMPKIVYGIMTFHRSHKIESPDPSTEFKINKPNACTACHTDKTSQWIEDESIKIWPKLMSSTNHNTIIQSLYKLHSGDPVERSIAAKNLGKNLSNSSSTNDLYKIPHLLFAMSDNYPAIRRFAFKSIKNVLTVNSMDSNQLNILYNTIQKFDFIADPEIRTPILTKAWLTFSNLDKSHWPLPPTGSLLNKNYKINRKELIKLRDLALKDANQINIGE